MRHPFGETVQRIRFLSDIEDAHGNTVDGYDDPVDITGVAVAPTATDESLTSGERVTDRLTLYFEPTADVEDLDPRDRFIVRDLTYEVVGSFLRWANPFDGVEEGGTVYVERVTG
jgi:hypothetical protein